MRKHRAYSALLSNKLLHESSLRGGNDGKIPALPTHSATSSR